MQKYEQYSNNATATADNNDSRSSTGCSGNTLPGVSQLELMQLKMAYCRCIGDLNATVAWYLENLINDGMEVPVILNAINETAWARRPSPYYMKCILERYKRDGIFTAHDLKLDQIDYATQQAEKRENWWT